MYQHHITGMLGEDKVKEYLLNNNYLILEQNFSCFFGEIDIIAKDKNELVFIEVKTRRSNFYGVPSESVTPTKKRHIKKVAEYFLYRFHLEREFIRFDVIEVLIDKMENYNINHIKQAF